MWAVLSWMRAVAVEDGPVWDVPTGRSKRKRSTPSGTRPIVDVLLGVAQRLQNVLDLHALRHGTRRRRLGDLEAVGDIVVGVVLVGVGRQQFLDRLEQLLARVGL